jgi:hypothetical protein
MARRQRRGEGYFRVLSEAGTCATCGLHARAGAAMWAKIWQPRFKGRFKESDLKGARTGAGSEEAREELGFEFEASGKRMRCAATEPVILMAEYRMETVGQTTEDPWEEIL